MGQSKTTISNKLNLQGLQSCQSVECSIWYNVDQVIVKIPVKKLYYIDMLILKKGKEMAKQVLNTPSAYRFYIEQLLVRDNFVEIKLWVLQTEKYNSCRSFNDVSTT